MRDNLDLIPAIIFVGSPHDTWTVDREIFDAYPFSKIILVEGEGSAESYFSENDVLLRTEFMCREKLDQIYRQLVPQYQVMAVLGFSEIAVFGAAYLADKFGVEGIGTDVALRCRDKFEMVKSLNVGGVKTPNSFVATLSTRLNEEVEAIGGYPVICKPLMGFASMGVIRADDEISLRCALRKVRLQNKFMLDRYYESDEAYKQVLVQSFIAGDEVAIDGYVRNGRAHILAIIDKPDVSQGPYFDDRMHVLPSKLDARIQSELKNVAQASVAATELDNSLFHLEVRVSKGQTYVLEIAARVGFMHSIRDALGIDICRIMVALKMGVAPDAEPKHHRYAGNLCVTADRIGEFVDIDNIDTVMADPRIVAIPRFVSCGTRVAPAPNANAYIVNILSAADSYASIEDALYQAGASLNIIIK